MNSNEKIEILSNGIENMQSSLEALRKLADLAPGIDLGSLKSVVEEKLASLLCELIEVGEARFLVAV